MTTTSPWIGWRMINASICAYQIHEQGWTPGPEPRPPVLRTVDGPGGAYFYDVTPEYQDQVGFAGSAAGGYAPLFAAAGEDRTNAALVGALQDGNLVVAIRGALPPILENNDLFEWIRDWMQDADIPPTPWSMHKGPHTNIANVETGFAKAMLSLWPHIKAMIDATLSARACGGVVVTGHSKGAAMAFLAAMLIDALYPQFSGRIAVHAFAAPPVGDAGFGRIYGGLGLEAASHRYQVENDLVPFVPLWREADIFRAIEFKKLDDEAAWSAFAAFIARETEGGYEAVGDFTYFNSAHQLVLGAVAQETALPAVAEAMMAGAFARIAAAHSVVDSYLPCFRGRAYDQR